MTTASCAGCGQRMHDGAGCTVTTLAGRKRVRYGDEDEDWGADQDRPCHDCRVEPGQHHHVGCDVARCPDCGGQEHEGSC